MTPSIWFVGAITDPKQTMAIYFSRFYHRSSGLEGLQYILTVVDRYTKITHFVPSSKEITSEETIGIVMREVFRPSRGTSMQS